MDEITHEVDDTIQDLDENGDGMLNEEEYAEGASNDLGDELHEQARADEDLPDVNDPNPAGEPPLPARPATEEGSGTEEESATAGESATGEEPAMNMAALAAEPAMSLLKQQHRH